MLDDGDTPSVSVVATLDADSTAFVTESPTYGGGDLFYWFLAFPSARAL